MQQLSHQTVIRGDDDVHINILSIHVLNNDGEEKKIHFDTQSFPLNWPMLGK